MCTLISRGDLSAGNRSHSPSGELIDDHYAKDLSAKLEVRRTSFICRYVLFIGSIKNRTHTVHFLLYSFFKFSLSINNGESLTVMHVIRRS